MFVDTVKIHVKAGDGGDGAVAFHREKYVAAGGPDGGDGGRGGDVIFRASPHLSTLADFKYKRKYAAERGADGSGNNCAGKRGKDLIIEVPTGTLVRLAPDDTDDEKKGRILADISDGEDHIIARGGRGGWGNSHFATPTRQAPRFAKPGIPGENFSLVLELKLLADVGLVGFPNVGKSSLISVVSEAKPAIGDYHFTTISPVLGVVDRGEAGSFVMADIPGLIEGACGGAGLGHQFLRHAERCRMLIHMVDVSGIEGRDPKEDFEIINRELGNFNPELAKRPMIVAGNKIDMATEEQQAEFCEYIVSKGYKYFPIMAAIRHQVDPLLNEVSAMLQKLPPIERYEPDPVPVQDLSDLSGREFTVRREGDVYIVEGEWLLQVMRSVNFDDYESLQYFERALSRGGVIDALREAGVRERDTVSIYDIEFDFVN